MTKRELIKWLKENNYDSVAIDVEQDNFKALNYWVELEPDSDIIALFDLEFDEKLKNYLRLHKLKQYD